MNCARKSPSLWIRSAQTSNAKSLIENWLKEINYNVITGIAAISADRNMPIGIYNLSGIKMNASSQLSGIYIVNGAKTLILK